MPVARDRISVSMLAWVGARCWTRTKAIPVSTGSARSICVKASSPPAEAPMPTIGKDGVSSRGPASSAGELAAGGVDLGSAGAGSAGLRFLRAIAIPSRTTRRGALVLWAKQARKTRVRENKIALDTPAPFFYYYHAGFPEHL